MKKLTKLLSFSGRIKRSRFLRFLPVALLVWLGAAYADETWLAPNLCHINEEWICYLPGEVRDGLTLDRIVFVLLLWPLFSLLAKRLHDHDRSGWWSLLALPLVAVLAGFLYMPELGISYPVLAVAAAVSLPLFYWIIRKGMKGENRFG